VCVCKRERGDECACAREREIEREREREGGSRRTANTVGSSVAACRTGTPAGPAKVD
jgi:hypothetical protein